MARRLFSSSCTSNCLRTFYRNIEKGSISDKGLRIRALHVTHRNLLHRLALVGKKSLALVELLLERLGAVDVLLVDALECAELLLERNQKR